MYKEIKFWDESRNKILRGVNIVSDAVCATLGPRGTHVIFEEWLYPTITKDGVTVAQQVLLEDKFENMGVMLAREAAETTNRVAGDWTTSTIAILKSIVNEWCKNIAAGMNPILIKRWMDKALEVVLDLLNKQTKTIKTREEKVNIATISTNNDQKLGEMIVDVIDTVGKDWVITVTTNNTFNTEVEYVVGTKLDGGFETSIFINDSKRLTSTYENPSIIVVGDRVMSQQQLIPVLQALLKAGKREIVLFAEWFDSNALAFLIRNFLEWKFVCIPVRFPSFGWYQKDIMLDFATLIGARVIWEEYWKKIEDTLLEDIWTCERIIISRDSSIITGWSWDVTERLNEVKALIEWEADPFRSEKLKERLGKLNGKIANIKVWWASSTEQSEIKYRIEDALNATKSAIETGIVEWAWTALLRCSSSLSLEAVSREFDAWVEMVRLALAAPFKKIISNGGENADAILWKVLESNLWYNSLTKKYEDLFESGIIDPKKVVESEIINAVATAWILLTSSVAIAHIAVKDSK